MYFFQSSLEAEHDDRDSDGSVSWVKSVKLKLPHHNTTVHLLPLGKIKVGDSVTNKASNNIYIYFFSTTYTSN